MQSQDPATLPAAKLAAGQLLSDVELASFLGIAVQTIRNWRWRGEGPRFVKLGDRVVRYRPADIQAFIEAGAMAGKAA